MPNIDYEEDKTKILQPKSRERNRSRSFGLATVVVLVSLIIGLVGGIGSIYLLSYDNGNLAKKLGVENATQLPVSTTKTEKVVLEESNAIIETSSKVSPAVVSIATTQVLQDIFGRTYQASGAGTGFIITNDGLIITNKHVVAEESTQ